jgi:uncharacterized membrane-anchored protein
MKISIALAAASVVALSFPSTTLAQTVDEAFSRLPWQTYPGAGDIGGKSKVNLTEDLMFLGPEGTKAFMTLTGNIEGENEYTLMSQSSGWFAVLTYEDTGHIPDDEQIDADALLADMKQGNLDGQKERRDRGLDVLVLDGWAVEPHYDLESKRLEWGTRIHIEGTDEQIVNYTARLLGRTGLTSATLVADPAMLEQSVAEFHTALAGFSYVAGQSYGEYRQGDKLAEYGLMALIAGGAAAVATKSGFLKTFGIALVAGLAAVGGAVSTFFRKIFRKKSS